MLQGVISRCAVQALLKTHEVTGEWRIVDAVVCQGDLVHQMKNTSSLFLFEIRGCPAVLSAQNWQKPVGPKYTHLLSKEVWSEVVFVEELQPKAIPPT